MKEINSIIASLFFLFILQFSFAQSNHCYWQQRVTYKMDVAIDVDSYTYTGKQELTYTNNSQDTLHKVYYHLYFNAFQPGSDMDMRLQSIPDPDDRMLTTLNESRIAALNKDEIGYLRATSLTQDGSTVKTNEEGTILVVSLAKPLLPESSTVLAMEFEGQIPLQIRRAGRNSVDNVALSMSQWYPKIAAYDFEGWHADPYIAREFHGVWGDFDVKLTLDKNYTVGGTGYLQNANEIGHGYEQEGFKIKKQKGNTLTWHFKAPMVHDFMWAADPNYIHDVVTIEEGPTLHFLYKNDKRYKEAWEAVQPLTVKAMAYFNKTIGTYPYKQYSVIQGGDGGMEYAMATLIAGGDAPKDISSTMIHELAHSWFQQVLATNEGKHAWMDEGFTSFISALCSNEIKEKSLENPFRNSYKGYYYLVASGKEQPQSTHADRYAANMPYGITSYNKGAIFLSQLGYIIGWDNLMNTLQKFYKDFKFKHPTPNDIKRTAEKVSGMELDWYLTDWTQTTNTVDYAITSVVPKEETTSVTLERIGLIPMPIDILVVYKDDTRETFYAPLRMLRGEKENPYLGITRTVLPDWSWAQPQYSFEISKPLNTIAAIVLDPSQYMADVAMKNNVWEAID